MSFSINTYSYSRKIISGVEKIYCLDINRQGKNLELSIKLCNYLKNLTIGCFQDLKDGFGLHNQDNFIFLQKIREKKSPK